MEYKMLEKLLKDTQVYHNQDLQNHICELEEKYQIIDRTAHYSNLVNFSQNKNVSHHNWFKYREGFAGELTTELILNSTANKKEYIVDPFVGSGTTLVSAVNMGYNAIGIDVNPIATKISQVKSSKYTPETLKHVQELITELEDTFSSIKFTKIQCMERYFSEQNFQDLLKIKNFIDSINTQDEHEIFLTAYLSIIEDCSDRKRDGNGLKTKKTKVGNVLKYFVSKLKQIIKDIACNEIKENVQSYTFCGDAKKLSNYFESITDDSKKVGAIIFSPPYANSFDYFESYKMEIEMGGFTSKELTINDLRNTAVRSFIGRAGTYEDNKWVNLLAEDIEYSIPEKETESGKKDARTRKVPQMIKGYFSDMENIIKECSKILTQGKKCYIVVDQSSYLGKIVPTDLLFAEIGEKFNLKVNSITICRKAKTSAQQLLKYPYLRNYLRESIVEFEKK